MALTFDGAESRLSEEMEREHEIRNLKETVGALREALEKQKAGDARGGPASCGRRRAQ